MQKNLLSLMFALVWGLTANSTYADEVVTRDESVAELKTFDRYIGRWTYMMKSSDGIEVAGEIETVWIHGGKLVRQKWTMDPAAGLPAASGENIMTFDVAKKGYRQWSFNSFGQMGESTGKWDEGKQTMTWSGKDSLGNTTTTHSAFKGKDKEEFRITTKSESGEVLTVFDGASTKK